MNFILIEAFHYSDMLEQFDGMGMVYMPRKPIQHADFLEIVGKALEKCYRPS